MNRANVRLFLVVGPLSVILAACASPLFSIYTPPPSPESRGDIARTSANADFVRLSRLKVEDFPALKKFHKLNGIIFPKGNATDEKLEALARLGLTNLSFVNLGKCPQVTDRGMEALRQIASIKGLVLRGASITDQGLEAVASKQRLSQLDVPQCTNVTARSLLKAIQIESLYNITFSGESLAEADVVQILCASRNLRHCYIDAPNAHLRTFAVRAAATTNYIRLELEDKDYWYDGRGRRRIDVFRSPQAAPRPTAPAPSSPTR